VKKRYPATLALLTLLLGAKTVSAQQLDYGRYEGLFDEPVTVSATGKPERVSDTPVIMDLITADDISRSGARDIPTLLRRMAGVDVTHASPGTAETAVDGYMQPLGSRVMVTLNGRQVYFDGFGEDFWATLPVEMEEIRQIEVIKGSQSALYGFNAVDGVINIVTFDPVDDKVNMVRGQFGNHALRDGAASVTQSLGDGSGVRLTAADDHVHDYGMLNKTAAYSAYARNPDRRSASVDAGITLSDGSRLDVEASHSDVSMRWIALNPLFDTRIKTDSIKGSYTAETPVGSITGTAYFTSIDMPWVQSQTYGAFNTADRVAVAQVSDLFKWGASDSFRIGGEARHSEMSAGSLTGGGLVSGDLAAGSLMWEHYFTPAVSTVNAVRYDHFQLGRSGPSPASDPFTNSDFDRAIGGFSVNSALIDKVTDLDSLRLSFARGLKLPSLNSFGQVEKYLPNYGRFTYYGSPNLDIAAIYDYRLGWEHKLNVIDATVGSDVFHQMTMKEVSSAYGLFEGVRSFVSDMSAGSQANGLELTLKHKAKTGWNWGGNYTYERIHEHFDWGYRDALPTNKVNVNTGYALGDWEADLYATYVSPTRGLVITPATPTTRATGSLVTIKDYTILAPRVGWHATDNVTVEAVAENLWPYQDSTAQRMETSYYLSVKVTY
jgi:iron complex outermembrane receptor protein